MLKPSLLLYYDFPGGADGKASAYSAEDLGSIPRSGRSSGEGNGNPFHHSCLGNLMGRGTWCATVHGVRKSQTRLSIHVRSGRNKEKYIYSILSGSRNPSPFLLKMNNNAICSIRGKKDMIGTDIFDGSFNSVSQI